jgi:hypothetical protein
LTTNCINVSAQLPAARQACVQIPKVSGLQVRLEQQCKSLPTIVSFNVSYTSKAGPRASEPTDAPNPSAGR